MKQDDVTLRNIEYDKYKTVVCAEEHKALLIITSIKDGKVESKLRVESLEKESIIDFTDPQIALNHYNSL